MRSQESASEKSRGEVGAMHEGLEKHANSKYMKSNENGGEIEDEDITWSQVFNMMYNDAKEIISPISKIVNYVAPDPNEEDSRQARAAFEEKMSKQVKQPIRKYKIGSPGAIHMVDETTGEMISIPRGENLLVHQQGLGGDGSGNSVKKRGLLGGLKEENVKNPIGIIESAQNIESFYGVRTVQESGKEKKVDRGSDWEFEGDEDGSCSGDSRRDSSPGIKNTPSTQCNTDSSPCAGFSKGNKTRPEKSGVGRKEEEEEEDEDYYYRHDYSEACRGMTNLQIEGCQKEREAPEAELFIPRLPLSEKRRSVSKKRSEEDFNVDKDHISFRMHSERKLTSFRSRFERAPPPHNNHHSHAYTMENIAGAIQRPITTSREEILKLYSKEELEKIQSFVEKANDLVYEGPLEKKNSWSWGYKLRWVRIHRCEMHYFLSPNESKLKAKAPLGAINFKVAEWNLQVSDSDDKTFTIVARGSTSNGRRYQWRIPSSSDQNRKSWTTRIEKILKAAAFMQQLKGIIRIPA